jgi:hypothetical protein
MQSIVTRKYIASPVNRHGCILMPCLYMLPTDATVDISASLYDYHSVGTHHFKGHSTICLWYMRAKASRHTLRGLLLIRFISEWRPWLRALGNFSRCRISVVTSSPPLGDCAYRSSLFRKLSLAATEPGHVKNQQRDISVAVSGLTAFLELG